MLAINAEIFDYFCLFDFYCENQNASASYRLILALSDIRILTRWHYQNQLTNICQRFSTFSLSTWYNLLFKNRCQTLFAYFIDNYFVKLFYIFQFLNRSNFFCLIQNCMMSNGVLRRWANDGQSSFIDKCCNRLNETWHDFEHMNFKSELNWDQTDNWKFSHDPTLWSATNRKSFIFVSSVTQKFPVQMNWLLSWIIWIKSLINKNSIVVNAHWICKESWLS